MRPDESELLRYVDDQLEPARRHAVEAALAQHPDLAARVMADLSMRALVASELGSAMPPAPAATQQAAERLEAGFRRPSSPLRYARMAASALILLGAGWLGHAALGTGGDAEAGTLPPFVYDAIQAQRVAEFRAGLASQPEAEGIDTSELSAETGLRLPALPAGWTIRDAQVFPSATGPSVEIAILDENAAALFLYAAPAARFGASHPAPAATENGEILFWQVGQTVYALSAGTPNTDLSRPAEVLVSTLY